MVNDGKNFKVIIDFTFDNNENLTANLRSENADKLNTPQIENIVLNVIYQMRTDRYEKRQKKEQKENEYQSFWSKFKKKINLN